MSFLDLATLTMHRRGEMESRINTFGEKCDSAISDIKKLKMQAHSFVSQLNCEPTELKERFLNFMKKLDEYTYLITDFNLALGQIENIGSSEYTPVQDNSIISLPPSATYTYDPNNLMDALSESAPSTSCACSNRCPPEKPKRVKVPEEEQVLIAFSSSSTSSESVPSKKSEMVAKEVQCTLAEEMSQCTLAEEKMSSVCLSDTSPESLDSDILPQQTMLEVDCEYRGIIAAISGTSFWIVTDCAQEVTEFVEALQKYYQNNNTALTIEQARSLNYCAVHDNENFYYRALCLKEDKQEPGEMSLFLLDTGEIRSVPVQRVRPLAPIFCQRPPCARYCHFAGVNLEYLKDKSRKDQYDKLMNKYLNHKCKFHVDENESESCGVFVTLETGELLNDILVRLGFAVPIDMIESEESSESCSPVVAHGPPEVVASELDLDSPEYEDPVEAVTGYHNRDEEDICKHYKGGPNKTCFKGSRCTKKHIMKHPDGWTLDRVEVVGKIVQVPLPAPGTWVKVQVTAVPHFDRVYVNVVDDHQQTEEVPEFGVVLPPTTLRGLVRDMNSAAARATYKPLQIAPAPGEMVAAIYPPDGLWYRACVRIATRVDQSVEVQYIDYGTEMWIKEDKIRMLEPQFTLLPAQAIRCVLAGVFIPSNNSQYWARAKRALAEMVQDKIVLCHIIARDYDEIAVELLDHDDYSISHQLAAQGLVELHEYSIVYDSKVTQQVVVP